MNLILTSDNMTMFTKRRGSKSLTRISATEVNSKVTVVAELPSLNCKTDLSK